MTIQQRFEAFDKANPWVYKALVSIARAQVSLGYKVSINGLFEVVRHQRRIDKEEDFKMNNSYRSRYARKIKQLEADLVDCFATRELKAV